MLDNKRKIKKGLVKKGGLKFIPKSSKPKVQPVSQDSKCQEICDNLSIYVYTLQIESKIKELRDCLQIAWRTIDTLAFLAEFNVALIELPHNKGIYNHTKTHHLAFS